MLEKISDRRLMLFACLLLVLPQACVRVQLEAPATLPAAQAIQPLATEDQRTASRPATSTSIAPASTPVRFSVTLTLQPHVSVTAVKGNLFIRRGPDMAFNPVGVLYRGTSADALARDELSGWVQILIPGSADKGWVSVKTNYSKIEGEVSSLPAYTPTEWPVPGYLRNCSHHEMYILPGEIRLPSSLEVPDNETWLYPGRYTVYDLDVADYPEVMNVDIREGSDIEILVDGRGEHRKCP